MGGWWGDMVGGKFEVPFFPYDLDSGKCVVCEC